MTDYSNEEIIRGLMGGKSVKDIIELILLNISKLNLRVECVEESIDEIMKEFEQLGDE